jgi:hypothetical protein
MTGNTKGYNFKQGAIINAISIARRQIFHTSLTVIRPMYIIVNSSRQYVLMRSASSRLHDRIDVVGGECAAILTGKFLRPACAMHHSVCHRHNIIASCTNLSSSNRFPAGSARCATITRQAENSARQQANFALLF